MYEENRNTVLEVTRTDDFEPTGRGDHPAWQAAQRVAITPRQAFDHADRYDTWFKALWSEAGVYFFIHCEDPKLSATPLGSFEDLYTQDVAEVFLWPDESTPLYFEHNLSPFGSELSILVPNHDGDFLGWRPWHYENERQTAHRAHIRGRAEPYAQIEGWSVETFIPVALLKPLRNRQPAPGVEWRANVYRIDYDTDHQQQFQWCNVGGNFHRHPGFGTLRFV